MIEDKKAYLPHQQRVVDELSDLTAKIHKLIEFIGNSPIFGTIPEEEQKRLNSQLSFMLPYAGVLSERIVNF